MKRGPIMHKYRSLAAGLGLALLLTTAASTTYAESDIQQDTIQQIDAVQGDTLLVIDWCKWLPWFCDRGPKPVPPTPLPSPLATPELDSLLLFGVGLSGIGGYAVTRYRARRRRD
jgi:hypothetical protein